MRQKEVIVTPWSGSVKPTEEAIRRRLSEEALVPYRWSNGPHDTYAAHTHPHDKVIYVVSGSITFGLPELGQQLPLAQGDRLDLPRQTVHDASVGADGVVCLEAHR